MIGAIPVGHRLIGSTLDKYEVLQKIGEGGMATVYRGRHSTLDRDVAIKVLHPHLSSSTRNRRRFAREARAIEHLRHANILEIFDYSGLDASDCYIITEYVEGDTLTEVLHGRGRIPSEVVAIIGLRLSEALAYAHREGILHRDLKPDNIMLRYDGTLKLMDFGIARFLDESQVTMTGALVGSPAFMSPEQAREGKLDQRSDLFSLGTTLFYLVTGVLPFKGSNPSLILKNVIEANRPSVAELAPEMSASLADVIERLMATNVDDRFVSADGVADALSAVLAESNVDPDETKWGVRAYVSGPETYEDQLREHLLQVLILRGKERLGTGDHLGALRLFNRLLALDEDNGEVLALVQNLHGDPEHRGGGRAFLLVALALTLFGGAAYAWVYVERTARQAESVLPPEPAITSTQLVPEDPPPPESTSESLPVPLEVAPVRVREGTPSATKPSPRKEPRFTVVRPAPAPVEVPPVDPAGIADDPPSLVRVVAENFVGEVWIDGKYQGRNTEPEPFVVGPGSHVVELRQRYHLTWSKNVEISPGEAMEISAAPRPKPARISFRAPVHVYEDACAVSLNGVDMGTVGELSGTLVVKDPRGAHLVAVACPGDEPVEKRYASFIDPLSEQVFPAPS